MLFLNLPLVISFLPGTGAAICLGIALAAFYIYFNIVPRRDKSLQRRLRILIGGYELMLASITCFTSEVLMYVFILADDMVIGVPVLITNALVCAVLLFILLFNGIIRIFACSQQLGIMPRIYLLLFWWVPVANIIILRKFLDVSGHEYEFTVEKQNLNRERNQEELCKTKYPVLMVHGVFFRDWKHFNYWGRIPKELTDNGAILYYGCHQSSASVEQCGNELKQCILDIVQKTGCEKLNIIAHSKGGLDSRYAISCLGMGRHVAQPSTHRIGDVIMYAGYWR